MSNGAVTYDAEFNADTEAGKAALRAYAKEINAVKNEIAEQSRAAKRDFNEQSLAARATGASQEQLQKIQQQYFVQLQSIRNTQKQLTDQVVKGNYDALQSEEKLKKVREEVIAQIERETVRVRALNQERGHTIAPQQAASGSIQFLEGRNGIRTIENFLGNTLGLGGFFSLMFPIVGAIQSGKLLYELGEKVYEVGHKAAHAGEDIDKAFGEANDKLTVTVDSLAVQADKLQDNIDKLNGHPNNGLKTALDEARVYADKLRASLSADRKELEGLLGQHEVGKFGELLSGVASTGKQKEQLLSDHDQVQKDIDAANDRYITARAAAKSMDDVKAAEKRRDADIEKAQRGPADRYKVEIERLRREQASSRQQADQANAYAATQGHGVVVQPIDNSAKIANLQGLVSFYERKADIFRGEQNVNDLTEQERIAKQKKEGAKLTGEESRKALEAQRKAEEEQRRLWDEEHADWQGRAERDASDEQYFWAMKAAEAKEGSKNYLEAMKKSNEALRPIWQQTARLEKENEKIIQNLWLDMQKAELKGEQAGLETVAKRGTALAAALQQDVKSRRSAANEYDSAKIDQDERTGQISRQDAALQRAALHAREYEQALQDLNDQRDSIANDDPDRATKLASLGNEQAVLDGKRRIEEMRDNADLAAQTWQDALRRANAAWVEDARDSGKQIVGIYRTLLDGLNSNLADTLMHVGEHGHRHLGRELGNAVGGTFRNVGGQLASIGLQRAEAGILGKFGIGGKADGSKGNPFSVNVLNLPQIAGSSIASAVTGSATGSGAGSAVSSVVSGIFGGFRASGGPVEAGKTYIVGEHGPEPVTFGANGAMGTNRDFQAMNRGGSHYWAIDVDARNAHDPAMVQEAVNRGIMAAAPHIVNAAVARQKDDRARSPHSAA